MAANTAGCAVAMIVLAATSAAVSHQRLPVVSDMVSGEGQVLSLFLTGTGHWAHRASEV